MITSPAYAKRLRRKALRLMSEVEAQADIACANPVRRAIELELRAALCADLARDAERIFERLRRSGF